MVSGRAGGWAMARPWWGSWGPLPFCHKSWFTVENHPFYIVKGKKYWRYTHFEKNHEYGRKGEHVEIGSVFCFKITGCGCIFLFCFCHVFASCLPCVLFFECLLVFGSFRGVSTFMFLRSCPLFFSGVAAQAVKATIQALKR